MDFNTFISIHLAKWIENYTIVRSESEYSLEKILSGFSGMNYYKKGLTKLLNLI